MVGCSAYLSSVIRVDDKVNDTLIKTQYCCDGKFVNGTS